MNVSLNWRQSLEENTESLREHYQGILEQLGEDPTREGLRKTPERAARAMQFLTKGYHEDLKTIVNEAVFSSQSDEMIIVKDIELYSLCEHHVLPFIGKCHVAYLPQGSILGLSKVARIVELFARRLQIQEELTRQIADGLVEVLNPLGVGVVIQAQHMCMMMRGVEKQNSIMTTSVMRGCFRDQVATRQEFLSLVG